MKHRHSERQTLDRSFIVTTMDAAIITLLCKKPPNLGTSCQSSAKCTALSLALLIREKNIYFPTRNFTHRQHNKAQKLYR